VRASSASLAVSVAIVLLTACGTAEDDRTGGAPPETTTAAPDDGAGDAEEPDEPGGGDEVDVGPGEVADLDDAVDAAVADLAAAAGVDARDVEVVTAQQVTWSDGSLGCPEPGMMYTQALVPGYRIVLAVGGDEVAYHGAEGAAPGRCDDPQPPSDPGS
jgi:hypothetical protein